MLMVDTRAMVLLLFIIPLLLARSKNYESPRKSGRNDSPSSDRNVCSPHLHSYHSYEYHLQHRRERQTHRVAELKEYEHKPSRTTSGRLIREERIEHE